MLPRQVSATSQHELFWSMGDSGPQLDIYDNGQNPNTLHGSIIRIVVTSEMNSAYMVPAGNPYSGGGRSFHRPIDAQKEKID